MSMLFNYVSEPNSNLLCCICRMPFIEPATTRSCAHTFCRTCIVQALGHAPQCPVDRSPLSVDDLQPANPIIRSLVDELIVECIHRPSGCPHTCQRQILTTHVADACPYSPVSCPKGECDQTLVRKDAQSHKCPHTLVPCDLCGAQIQFADLQTHISECDNTTVTCESCAAELSRLDLASHECPAALVPCTQASNGCAWTGPRTALSMHLISCPYEAIHRFFALNDSKFDTIAQDNLLLRHKVDTLQGIIQSMKHELQSVKAALGPWYRPDGVYAYTGPASDLPPDLQPSNASTSRRFSLGDAPPPPHASHDMFAAYFPSETTDTSSFEPAPRFDHASQDMFAAYFPSEPTSLETAARRRTLPAFRPGEPFAGPPAQQHMVAPVNLSATLEGAFAGVRDSVVALATAVDSLGRRADIALANETLRLNDEVMSLRVNVHGLRMQVHTIMMDRNAQVTGRSAEIASDGAWPLHGRLYHTSAPGQSITKL
ncbi:hypothetical protein GGX14DRAFT_517238 [Mycena pura]|uniref:Uncharacterized protein n=1 Tax=Mycena pura TaxID=153505 RepID=A0AAD6YJ39_9AGAR|nr:hypothetical protein GGX14DRAFT_517238 [Mycena pura]